MTGWSLKGLCDGYVRKDVQLAVGHMRFADTALLGMDSRMRRDVTTGEETHGRGEDGRGRGSKKHP